jgi:hypothetical protein
MNKFCLDDWKKQGDLAVPTLATPLSQNLS